MPSIINSDDGVVSGTSGLKTTGGNDGVTTFQQNGTEKMRITSSGNVGIGTNAPAQILDISRSADSGVIVNLTNANTGSSAVAQYIAASDSATGFLSATSSANTNDTYGGRASTLSLITSSANTAGGIALLARNAAGYITLHTGGNTERMRIDSSGNVGIGTSAPTEVLTVNGSVLLNTAALFKITGSDSTTSQTIFRAWRGGAGDETGTYAGFRTVGDGANGVASLIVDVGSSEAMRITSAGNVGIGTSSPTYQLSVGGASATGGFAWTSSSPNQDLNIYAPGRTGSWAGNIVFHTSFNTTTTSERMRITSAGEVLVGGTTNISSLAGVLTIERNAGGLLNLYRNDTTVASGDILGGIQFYGNDTTSNTPTALSYIYATASGTHAAGDNPTDIVFGCTNDGSETVAEFARLGQAGSSGMLFQLSQPTLTDNQSSYFYARGGTAGTANRNAQVGVYKHSGITNCCGYLAVATEDNVNNFLWADNSDVLRISTTASNIGTTGGTVVGTQTSDERLKDISGPVTYGLNEVLAIEPIAFTMKDDPSIPKIGFSAQQVQPIVPEAVYDTKECIDGYTEDEETKEQIPNSDRTKLAMEYTQLIPVLVNAVKELKAELDSVKAELAALRGN